MEPLVHKYRHYFKGPYGLIANFYEVFNLNDGYFPEILVSLAHIKLTLKEFVRL